MINAILASSPSMPRLRRASPASPHSCAPSATTSRPRSTSRSSACRSISASIIAPARARAPAAVREASRLIRARPSDQRHRALRHLQRRRCRRCAGQPDRLRALDQDDRGLLLPKIQAVGAVPITIGGDHTVPLPILQSHRQGQPGRHRADRRPCRYARHARRDQDQPRDDLPPRRRGGADRSEARRSRSACAAAASRRRHRLGRGAGLHLHHLRSTTRRWAARPSSRPSTA